MKLPFITIILAILVTVVQCAPVANCNGNLCARSPISMGGNGGGGGSEDPDRHFVNSGRSVNTSPKNGLGGVWKRDNGSEGGAQGSKLLEIAQPVLAIVFGAFGIPPPFSP